MSVEAMLLPLMQPPFGLAPGKWCIPLKESITYYSN